MPNQKYKVVKHEATRKVEKVEYVIDIPNHIKNKAAYAERKLEKGNYENYKITDILDSELLDEEIVNIKKIK